MYVTQMDLMDLQQFFKICYSQAVFWRVAAIFKHAPQGGA